MNKILALMLLFNTFAYAARYEINSKSRAEVEILEKNEHYLITCKFLPQTKFSDDRNASMNVNKARSICEKGLHLHLNVSNEDILAISGLVITGPAKMEGKKIVYNFLLPVDGCKFASQNKNNPSKKSARPLENILKEIEGNKINKTLADKPRDFAGNAVLNLETKKIVEKKLNEKQELLKKCKKKSPDTDFTVIEDFVFGYEQEFNRIRKKAEKSFSIVRQKAQTNRKRILSRLFN